MTSESSDAIRRPTVQPARTQIADAVINLSNGHTATLTIQGYVITCYVRWVTNTEDRSIYATWIRDHLTDQLTGAATFVLPILDHQQAVALAYADLEMRVQRETR